MRRLRIGHALAAIPLLLPLIAHQARAQPAPPDSDPPLAPDADDAPLTADDAPIADDAPAPLHPAARPGELIPLEDRTPEREHDEELSFPMLINSPTARLLKAGVITSAAGVDTGGGFKTDLRLGLGDVAEFGLGTTELIQTRSCTGCTPDSVSNYPLALFKMGVAERRVWSWQPAMALGFRKSFEREHDDRKSQVAELYLVASRRVGMLNLHFGGSIWDASIKRNGNEVLLHDRGFKKQLRPFGGFDVKPLPRSTLMVDLVFVPQFDLREGEVADRISLRPVFAFGVRYEFTDWVHFKSGVRIPFESFDELNLMPAQIFGQIEFVNRRFSRFIEGINTGR